ncbi:MAG: glucose 1-dehydrogenase [Caldilineaceae bacterium]|nr:glucose 1-dehydrogenase [Caldilineaceae bacterium]MBP8108197.1 glucose 1-dehydrogenase [Caldilineaceae bacterium]MBP8124239.1 glucose 1-dehydrogenase [Caldilineaceae bacterium]MBP9074211.1 glucose 1-dehydrogenase [Caldilineaceae bacterium]
MPTSSLFDLTGKVAIVTGGSRGIGFEIAKAFAGAGAQVVIASRKQADLDAAAAQIRTETGGDILAVAAHTGDAEAVDALVARTVEAFGGVDILVNNAATNPHFGPIMTAEESHWAKIMDVNVVGYFRMVKACVASMAQRGGGSVINMASVAGKTPIQNMGVYCVSKAAVLMLTEVLAGELAAQQIRVNAVAPGFVKTKFSAALWQNEQIYNAVVKAIPQGRMADAPELAGIALYLASDASSFTTGATFVVDGGQLIR